MLCSLGIEISKVESILRFESQLSRITSSSPNLNPNPIPNPQVKANYLASPPLVVAHALAGELIDFESEPLGSSESHGDVYLKDPSPYLVYLLRTHTL